jgi:formate dehydrogenase major subunit
MKKVITLTVNGQQVRGSAGDSVLDVCRANGIDVPTLCHLDGLSDVGGCRMCIVEVEKERRPVPSCTYPARDGLVVKTHTEQIEKHRRLILELLFTERNHFCMFCEKSGHCDLQTLAYRYKMDNVRFEYRFPKLPLDALSDSIVIDHNRCTLCGRCIRACKEWVGNNTLDFGKRGWKTTVVADLAQPLAQSSCTSCGACVEACPTGAIFTKQSIYKGKPQDCQRVKSVCPTCGVGCQLDVLVKDNNVVRIDSGEPESPRGTLCRQGRFELLRASAPRITTTLLRNAQGVLEPCSLDKAVEVMIAKINELRPGFAGIASPILPNETLSRFGEFMRKGVGTDLIDTTDGAACRIINRGITDFQPNATGADIECSLDEIVTADCILVVGANPLKTHPVVASLVQRAKLRQGAKVVVIDPVRNPFPLWTDLWLQPKPGTEGALIAGIARTHLFTGLLTVQREGPDIIRSLVEHEKYEAAKVTGINEAQLDAAVSTYGKAQKAVIIYGQDLIDSAGAAAITYLLKLASVTGNAADGKLRVASLKSHANSRGAWQLGLCASEIKWDQVRGLYLMLGEDPLEEELVARLAQIPFVVVQAAYHSPATEHAHVVLPSYIWSERAGEFVTMDGRVVQSRHATERQLAQPGMGELLSTLSAKLGHAMVVN